MFSNYLTVAVRNLLKSKGLTAINILGLALGMACVILIGLFIQYEFSYDRFHANADRIYHVFREVKMENASQVSPRASGALAPALKQEFPEVEQAIRVETLDAWIKDPDKGQFFQQTLYLADKEILDIFTIPFVIGDPKTAFNSSGSMVLTESMAHKFFGNENPVGKVLLVDHNELSGDYHVTGVVRDFPPNSTFQFDCLTTTPKGRLAELWDTWEPAVSYRPFETFVLLRKGEDYRQLERKLPAFIVRHMGEEVSKTVRYRLQPLVRAHLYTGVDLGQYYTGYGDIKQVYAFGLVAAFVLLLACINFMNLSTARSTKRAREVGLRKVVGAYRQQLVVQFLGESVLMALAALVVAVIGVALVLPWFDAFMQRSLVLFSSENLWWLVALIGLGFIVGMISGSYPAFVLSAFAPSQVMKGDAITGTKRAWLRKGLVVFQFAFSIVFITGTVVVEKQLDYIRHKDLGFDKSHVVMLPIFWYSWQIYHGDSKKDLRWRYAQVKRAFLQDPNVLKATVTRFPQGSYITTNTFQAEGSDADWQMGLFDIDQDYLDFFGIKLVAGRLPTIEDYRDFRTRGRPYLLNETAVRQLGWKDAVGKRFGAKEEPIMGHVVGVIKDFNMQSLHNPIRPVAFRVVGGSKNLYLKLGAGDLQKTMAFLAATWKRFLPEAPVEYSFLDEDLTQKLYENEIRTGKALAIFSGLTIFVACLGLFGLIAFRAEQKTKEIGIRKVVGASSGNIFVLLAKEFVVLIGAACVIACPIAFVLTRRWLEDFAFRIHLNAGVFLLGGAIALAIALATISYQAFKAARANPVDALRYE